MNTIMSGIVPQITVIMGPCAGGAVYSPAIGDFIVMVNNPATFMFITGPQVVKAVTGIEVSSDQLGGGMVHAQKSGQAHLIANSDEEALALVRRLVSYLPSNNMEKAPKLPTSDLPFRKSEKLYEIVPDDPNKGYDVRQVIYEIVDRDALPGVQQEYGGIIRHGAKVLYAYAEATVPLVTIILRKAYGGAYLAMGSKHLGADFVYAWPTAEIAVMGPEGAANIIFRKEIAKAENPEEFRQQKIKEYRDKFANPYVAAGRGYIDDVIDPAETRGRIIMALEALSSKRVKLPPKKHGNIPL